MSKANSLRDSHHFSSLVSQAKGPGGRSLVQGLKGDATYLIVTDDNKMETFGVNAVCTHLGCVVPWNKAANKFMCPCHGAILPACPFPARSSLDFATLQELMS